MSAVGYTCCSECGRKLHATFFCQGCGQPSCSLDCYCRHQAGHAEYASAGAAAPRGRSPANAAWNQPGDDVPSTRRRLLEQLGVGEELAQGVQLHRLGQVAVEARLVAAPPVFLLPPAGQRHQQHVLQTRLLRAAAGRPRSRPSPASRCPRTPCRAARPAPPPAPPARRGRSGPRGLPAAAAGPGSRRRPRCRPPRGCGGWAGRAPAARRLGRSPQELRFRSWARAGRRTTNSLPLPGPSLWAVTVPPCISTSLRTSVSPMPSPPCERSRRRSACTNRSKMSGSMSGGNADAGVPHPQHQLAALLPGRQQDGAPVVGVLGGVVEQVRHDLLQPGRVGLQT